METTTIDEIQAREARHVLQTYRRQPVTFVRGEGVRLYDADGREYLDLLSGIGVASLGHAHPGLARAIADQAQTLLHTSNLFYHPLQGQLAERLAKLSGLPRAFFCNSGTEAVEACLKFARRYWYTQRRAAGGIHRARGLVPRPDVRRAVGDVGRALPRAVRAAAAGRSIRAGQRAGGAAGRRVAVDGGDHRRADPGRRRRPPADAGVCRGDQRGCATTGALLIADEVQSGLGRTGYPFYSPVLGLQPDLVSVGKALGGGVPIGAALVSQKVADTIAFGDHGSTYGGNLLACRAALCFLDELDGGGLLGRSRTGRRPSRAGTPGAGRQASGRQGGSRRGADVGPRADARRGAGRSGRAGARRDRQPHGGNGRPAAAAARHHRSRRSTKRSAGSMRRSVP